MVNAPFPKKIRLLGLLLIYLRQYGSCWDIGLNV